MTTFIVVSSDLQLYVLNKERRCQLVVIHQVMGEATV